MDLTLAGEQYRVISREAVGRLSTNSPTRQLVDARNQPVPSPERIEAWDDLDRCNWLPQEGFQGFPRGPDQLGERKALRSWFARLGTSSPFLLAPVFFSAIAVLFGRGESCRLGVMVPLWILALVWVLVVFRYLLSDMWGLVRGEERLLHRLLVLSLLPTLFAGLLWPIMPFPRLRSFSFAVSVCSLLLYLLLILRFLRIFNRYTHASEFGTLNNSSPADVLATFYALLKTRYPSDDEEAARQEAAQYLASFRRSICIGNANSLGDVKWSENSTGTGRSLFHFTLDLIATARELACVGNRRNRMGFSLAQAVFLQSVKDHGPRQLLVYCAIDAYGTYEDWTSPSPDWDVKLGESWETRRIYDRKTLIQFEDGWFIENGSYDPPKNEEIEALKSAGVLS